MSMPKFPRITKKNTNCRLILLTGIDHCNPKLLTDIHSKKRQALSSLNISENLRENQSSKIVSVFFII